MTESFHLDRMERADKNSALSSSRTSDQDFFPLKPLFHTHFDNLFSKFVSELC